MKITLGALGSIASISATILFYFHHTPSGLVCAIIAIIFFISLACLGIKDRNSEKHKATPQRSEGFKAVSTDENTRLVIKEISDESNGFVTLNDIVRDTNLPLKTINKALDWLLMNNFAIQRKGRNGKVYILTPEGRSTFSPLINENINKPST